MSGPDWKLEDDRKTVTISFPTTPSVAVKLDTARVQKHLEKLGEIRASMTPEIEANWPPGQKVGVVPNPRWYVEPELMQGHSLLHIRDPRFGWLHYVIPRNEAKKLGRLLILQADMPPDSPPAKPS